MVAVHDRVRVVEMVTRGVHGMAEHADALLKVTFKAALRRVSLDPAAITRVAGHQEHIDADGRRVRISRYTLDRWVLEWNQGGFDALVPSPCRPRRRMPPEVRRRPGSDAGGDLSLLVGPRVLSLGRR